MLETPWETLNRLHAKDRSKQLPCYAGPFRTWQSLALRNAAPVRRAREYQLRAGAEPEDSAEKINKMDMIGFFRTYDSSPAAQALCFALGRMHPALPDDALTEKIRVFAQSPQNSLEDAANRAALVALIAAG